MPVSLMARFTTSSRRTPLFLATIHACERPGFRRALGACGVQRATKSVLDSNMKVLPAELTVHRGSEPDGPRYRPTAMRTVLTPFTFLVAVLAGWLNERQQSAVEFLREENRVLRQQLGRKRIRLTDDQRRRLALKGQKLGRHLSPGIATIVAADMSRRCHRDPIAPGPTRVVNRVRVRR